MPAAPNRYLLDSNMVLNAAFVEGSWARQVVEIAHKRNFGLFVGTLSLRDAHRRAVSLACASPRALEAATYVDNMLRSLGAVVVDPAPTAVHAAVPMHDAHVVREALAADATLITMDRELWLACRLAAITALVPIEVFRREYGVTLGLTAFGVAPTPTAGSLFARGHVGSWAKATGTRHTLIHFPGFAWLGYDTSKRAWIADFPGLAPLALRAEVDAQQFEAVSVSWQVGDQIRLRASSVDHPVQRSLLTPLPNFVPAKYQLGASADQKDYWNSTLWACVSTDRPVGKELWRDCKQHHDLTPNPFDDDRLDAAVRLWARDK